MSPRPPARLVGLFRRRLLLLLRERARRSPAERFLLLPRQVLLGGPVPALQLEVLADRLVERTHGPGRVAKLGRRVSKSPGRGDL